MNLTINSSLTLIYKEIKKLKCFSKPQFLVNKVALAAKLDLFKEFGIFATGLKLEMCLYMCFFDSLIPILNG